MFQLWVQAETRLREKPYLIWATIPNKSYTNRVDAELDAEKLRNIGFVVEVR